MDAPTLRMNGTLPSLALSRPNQNLDLELQLDMLLIISHLAIYRIGNHMSYEAGQLPGYMAKLIPWPCLHGYAGTWRCIMLLARGLGAHIARSLCVWAVEGGIIGCPSRASILISIIIIATQTHLHIWKQMDPQREVDRLCNL